MLSERIKVFERAVGRYSLLSARWIISHLPEGSFKMTSRILTVLGWPILFKKRRLTIENLTNAFGKEKSAKEIDQISWDCFQNFARGMVELIYFADRPDEIRKKVRFEGQEHLDAAFKKGSGVILVSAHFGNFILMYLRLIVEGYKTNIIMRRTRDQKFEEYITEFRDSHGMQTIYDLPARKCVQQSLKALRNNEILFILLDQNYGSDGRIFVDFFGRPAATAAGPIVFSNRTSAPILPIFIMRDGGEQHKIVIEPPVQLETGADEMDSTVKSVAKITKIIERYARELPYEWGGWMHKRWKSQAAEGQDIVDIIREESSLKDSDVSQGA